MRGRGLGRGHVRGRVLVRGRVRGRERGRTYACMCTGIRACVWVCVYTATLCPNSECTLTEQ